METTTPQIVQLLATLLVVLLAILASEHWRKNGATIDAVKTLEHEFRDAMRWFKVYSAETLRGQEAEFVRDRLPTRLPVTIVIALFVLYVAAAWWLAR